MDISRLRQRIVQLCQDRRKLEEFILAGKGPLLKGSIVKAYLKCVRQKCLCQKDKKARHGPYLYLHYTDQGKQKMVYVKEGVKVKVMEWTSAYRKFRSARARLVKLNLEILRLIDELEEVRRKDVKRNE